MVTFYNLREGIDKRCEIWSCKGKRALNLKEDVLKNVLTITKESVLKWQVKVIPWNKTLQVL